MANNALKDNVYQIRNKNRGANNKMDRKVFGKTATNALQHTRKGFSCTPRPSIRLSVSLAGWPKLISNAKILEWNSLTHSVTESAWELQDKNSGRCSESFCILPSTSLTTSLWTGCLVLISLCSLCALLLSVQDLQVFQLRHHRWHHSRRMANRIQCFPQGSS